MTLYWNVFITYTQYTYMLKADINKEHNRANLFNERQKRLFSYQ